MDYCTPNPCRNNGRCENNATAQTHNCYCTLGFEGQNCTSEYYKLWLIYPRFVRKIVPLTFQLLPQAKLYHILKKLIIRRLDQEWNFNHVIRFVSLSFRQWISGIVKYHLWRIVSRNEIVCIYNMCNEKPNDLFVIVCCNIAIILNCSCVR